MVRKWIVVLFILVSISMSNAIETAERISDREIVESLATLKEGQRAMNQRFDNVNKRFDDVNNSVNQRFDDVGKRFDQMFTFLWILTGIFTAMTAATISFAIWDRRSMLEPVNIKIKRLEEGKVAQLINSLKDLAKVDKNVAEALRRYNLF